jgi:acyl-CoA thioester hydrolase
MQETFKKWVEIPTRWIDMDPMGHVNSATYHTYFEIARMEYFDTVGLHALKVPGKLGPAVVSQSCNYRRQIFHPAHLRVGIRCTEIRNRTWGLEYAILVNGEPTPYADGSTVMAWVDYEQAKAVPLPEPLRESMRAYEEKAL